MALLALLALLCLSVPSWADQRYLGPGFVALLADGGEPVRWEGALIPVTVSLPGAPPGALEVARRAFASWEEALKGCGSQVRFLVRATNDEGSLDHRDQVNYVFWGRCDDVARTRTYAEPGRPALTCGFDMVLNRDKPWGVSPEGRVGYDIEAVLAHEIGHVLGLADVCLPPGGGDCPEAALTMYGFSRCGETLKRQLKPGDLRGVEFLYGQGPAARVGLTGLLAAPQLVAPALP